MVHMYLDPLTLYTSFHGSAGSVDPDEPASSGPSRQDPHYLQVFFSFQYCRLFINVCAGSVDPDEPARGEPSRWDRHYLQAIFSFLSITHLCL